SRRRDPSGSTSRARRSRKSAHDRLKDGLSVLDDDLEIDRLAAALAFELFARLVEALGERFVRYAGGGFAVLAFGFAVLGVNLAVLRGGAGGGGSRRSCGGRRGARGGRRSSRRRRARSG